MVGSKWLIFRYLKGIVFSIRNYALSSLRRIFILQLRFLVPRNSKVDQRQETAKQRSILFSDLERLVSLEIDSSPPAGGSE